jgi:hypothetical protein
MIKKITLSFLLLLLLSVTTFSQISKEELYQHKIETYTSLKKTGITFIGIGGGTTLLGTILLSTAEWETETSPTGQTSTSTSDGSGVFGAVLILVGVPSLITGTVLAIVGNSKTNEYKEKLDRIHVGLNYTPTNKGMKFTYRF